MNEFLRYQRMMCFVALLATLAATGAACALWKDTWPIPAGILLGGAVGFVDFRLKVLSILRFAQNPDNSQPRQATKTSFQSLALMLGALILALSMKDIFHPWATFAGLMIPRLTLALDGILRPGALAQPEQAVEPTGGKSE